MPEGFSTSRVLDVSLDGATVVGTANTIGSNGNLQKAFTWSAANGWTFLDLPEGLHSDGENLRISDDGKVVTSSTGSSTTGDYRAFRWTKETGAVDIDRLPDGPWMSAWGVSGDGSVIAGNSYTSPSRPAIWDAVHGARYLSDVLISELNLGAALAGWSLGSARNVSGDGRTVIGYGTNPQGNTEAWIAYLGAASTSDFDEDADVDGADFLMWQRSAGLSTGATREQGDANADGRVDAGDLAVWRSQFGSTSAAAAQIPEPNTLVLAGLVLIPLATRRRFRRCVRATIRPN